VFTGFWLGGQNGRDHWQDLGIDGKIIINNNNLREIRIGGANWIRLARDMVRWRAFVNTVMNLRVPLRKHDCLTS
jgi:hypothetical protein